MATYIIGDIQGCFNSLLALLDKIKFDKKLDSLILLGDLVNRGPNSLETLRFIYKNQNNIKIILGNHDVLAIALYLNSIEDKNNHTLSNLLNAPDRDILFNYLRNQKLILNINNNIFVHAGILPEFNIQDAINYSEEVCEIIKSKKAKKFLNNYFNNNILEYKDNLNKEDLYKLILVSSTRMRVCTTKNKISLSYDGDLLNMPENLTPWFMLREDKNINIYFGHWAALGYYRYKNYTCLDSGCIWGNKLTALRIEDLKLFQVNNQE